MVDLPIVANATRFFCRLGTYDDVCVFAACDEKESGESHVVIYCRAAQLANNALLAPPQTRQVKLCCEFVYRA